MKLGYITLGMISVLILASIGYAHEIDLSTFNIEDLVKAYNNNLDKVPGFAKKIFGNEKINVYIDGEIFAGFAGEGGKITEYKKEGIEKPTLRIYTTSETIGHLVAGEKTLLEAVKDKSITYEGVGFFSKIKFGFIKIFQRFFLRG